MQRKRGHVASQVRKADVNATKYNVISHYVSCVTDCKIRLYRIWQEKEIYADWKSVVVLKRFRQAQ